MWFLPARCGLLFVIINHNQLRFSDELHETDRGNVVDIIMIIFHMHVDQYFLIRWFERTQILSCHLHVTRIIILYYFLPWLHSCTCLVFAKVRVYYTR